MTGLYFTQEQQNLLLSNPYVNKVTERSITYSESFKTHAINEYTKVKTPSQIFREAGIDPRVIGAENPGRSLARWHSIYFKEGRTGLIGDRRGRGSSGRPKTSNMSLEERLIATQAKIAYLQMKNEFLKKLDELERRLEK